MDRVSYPTTGYRRNPEPVCRTNRPEDIYLAHGEEQFYRAIVASKNLWELSEAVGSERIRRSEPYEPSACLLMHLKNKLREVSGICDQNSYDGQYWSVNIGRLLGGLEQFAGESPALDEFLIVVSQCINDRQKPWLDWTAIRKAWYGVRNMAQSEGRSYLLRELTTHVKENPDEFHLSTFWQLLAALKPLCKDELVSETLSALSSRLERIQSKIVPKELCDGIHRLGNFYQFREADVLLGNLSRLLLRVEGEFSLGQINWILCNLKKFSDCEHSKQIINQFAVCLRQSSNIERATLGEVNSKWILGNAIEYLSVFLEQGSARAMTLILALSEHLNIWIDYGKLGVSDQRKTIVDELTRPSQSVDLRTDIRRELQGRESDGNRKRRLEDAKDKEPKKRRALEGRY